MSWRTLLILGGTGSGHVAFAESLLAEAEVRRLAADRRAGDLAGLAGALAAAKPDETVLVEDVSTWAGGDPSPVVEAVRACPARRLVLVSAEVGLAPPPTAATARHRAQALGDLNRALAEAVDAVALVVAGHPVWLKGAAAPVAAARAGTAALPDPASVPDLALRHLPTPDDTVRTAARRRLATAGLGALGEVVVFAAAAQGTDHPSPWQRVRMLVLHGDHAGAAAAGATGSAELVARLREGTSPLGWLAAAAGVGVQVVPTPAAAALEAGPAATDQEVEQALRQGWRLAEQAADEGVDAIVLGAVGAGAETAAAALVGALAVRAEPAAMLARVHTPDGKIDDQAWIARCAAVRDALHRARSAGRASGARPALAEVGGPDLATAAGVILGAAYRRTPVLIDGPFGTAAALAARNLAAPVRHWCLLPDHGQHPTAVRASEVLSLEPLLDLRLDLGEGAAALAALPLIRSALTLAQTGALRPVAAAAAVGEVSEPTTG
ncbi:MAG TPA: bifunctional adenosylcobinamide kinase/adenosylcobinamide-phosphate guanylyltransferase [Natronosporangium sp.]|nr:bifunctional adenosylcobinamide kinase/adenosylcobinamide-phosphate guanylyltransferase [Natronosporangium sp.]